MKKAKHIVHDMWNILAMLVMKQRTARGDEFDEREEKLQIKSGRKQKKKVKMKIGEIIDLVERICE